MVPVRDDPYGSGSGRLEIVNVTGQPGAPDPEPKPYYYGFFVNGPQERPKYAVTYCGRAASPEEISPELLKRGSPGRGTDAPPDKVQKSAVADLLEDRRADDPDDKGLPIDDTWSFKGLDD